MWEVHILTGSDCLCICTTKQNARGRTVQIERARRLRSETKDLRARRSHSETKDFAYTPYLDAQTASSTEDQGLCIYSVHRCTNSQQYRGLGLLYLLRADTQAVSTPFTTWLEEEAKSKLKNLFIHSLIFFLIFLFASQNRENFLFFFQSVFFLS